MEKINVLTGLQNIKIRAFIFIKSHKIKITKLFLNLQVKSEPIYESVQEGNRTNHTSELHAKK